MLVQELEQGGGDLRHLVVPLLKVDFAVFRLFRFVCFRFPFCFLFCDVVWFGLALVLSVAVVLCRRLFDVWAVSQRRVCGREQKTAS